MENQDLDFLMEAAKEEKSEEVTLVKLKALVDYYDVLEKEIEQLKKDTEIKEALFRKVSEEDIPMLLSTANLSEIKLADKRKVKVAKNPLFKIKDEDAFFNFLKERGEDDIIKLTVNFDKMLPEKRKQLERLLQEYDYNAKDSVHYQTAQKYFRELLGTNLSDEEKQEGLEEGVLIPEETIKSFVECFTTFKTTIK